MLAFTFPGQGSQKPGMGRAWVDHPSWEVVAEASELAGRDVARLLLDADADELKLPRNTQLSTFMLSMIVLDAVERVGIAPGVCAGHSLGEYTALTATGALSFQDGVRVVTLRGEAMQDAADTKAVQRFIQSLEIPDVERERLLAMTPATYIGKAAELAARMGHEVRP